MKTVSKTRTCLSLLLVVAGCAAPTEPEEERVGSAEEAMFARNTYESSDRIVPPFTAALAEQASFYGRTVGASDAFYQCVTNTMTDSYLNIEDPNPTYSHAAQVAAAWESFRHSYVDLKHGLRPQSDAPHASASAQIGDPHDYGTKSVTYYNDYRADFADWTDGLYAAEPQRPFDWRADTMIHEFMHAQGYHHSDRSCADNEEHPTTHAQVSSCTLHAECAWTSYCGGSGIPPAGMTYATCGDSHRQFTAVMNGLADTDYGLHGQPSAPYIYGNCAYEVVRYSASACGHATTGCPAGQLRLVADWTGEASDPQSSTACTCVQDPRHQISLTTQSGWSWTAASGGGGIVDTDWARGLGAWQTFWAVEYGGPGGWTSGEPVVLKSFDGHFLSSSFGATRTTPNYVYFVNASGGGSIGNGSVVNVYDTGIGNTWAYDNGTALATASSLGSSPNFDFVVAEPRYHLVYLKSAHGKFVNVDDAGLFFNKRSQGILEYGTALDPVTDPSGALIGLDPAIVAMQADSAFWIVDHDGGTLDDGDVVSIQIYEDDSWHFLSTFGSTGQAKRRNGAYTDERFVLGKVTPGGGTIQHGNLVSFKSSGNTYLTAMPADYFDAQIRNYATSVGAWQKFNLYFVHSFDMDRTAKW